MEWQAIGSITTSSNYTFTPVVPGSLFKLKHITESPERSNLKIAIRQAFEDNGTLSFFDYKLINCKVESDIVLFSLPKALTNRKLAFKRVDNYSNESWIIEIESLEIIEDGVTLPISISDVTSLQERLDAIQAELVTKAFEMDLASHIQNNSNPHQTTAAQVGADVLGTAVKIVTFHESTINHPTATPSSRGMMSNVDKAKLNTIAEGATANSSDSYLLDRSKHNGEQPIASITNLVETLLTFVKLTGSQIISGVKSFNNLVYLSQHLISNSYLSAREYYLSNSPLSLEIARYLEPIDNYCINLGYFDIPNGGVSFRVSLIISDSDFSIAKNYAVTTTYRTINTGWLKLVPSKESIYAAYNNCEVDILMVFGTTYLRVRRVGGNGSPGTAYVRIEFTGYSGTYFEQTYGVAVDNNVTGTY